jgi:hypothetical protein
MLARWKAEMHTWPCGEKDGEQNSGGLEEGRKEGRGGVSIQAGQLQGNDLPRVHGPQGMIHLTTHMPGFPPRPPTQTLQGPGLGI